MDLLVSRSRAVHYEQARPMQTRHIASESQLRAELAAPHGVAMDCSESVTLLCKLAGLHDPNGLHYNGTGYTGTLLRLPHYHDPAAANVGALVVFFGTGVEARTGAHVGMVRRTGHDPLLFTHGSERDPSFRRLSYEASGFHGYTLLSIADLG